MEEALGASFEQEHMQILSVPGLGREPRLVHVFSLQSFPLICAAFVTVWLPVPRCCVPLVVGPKKYVYLGAACLYGLGGLLWLLCWVSWAGAHGQLKFDACSSVCSGGRILLEVTVIVAAWQAACSTMFCVARAHGLMMWHVSYNPLVACCHQLVG